MTTDKATGLQNIEAHFNLEVAANLKVENIAPFLFKGINVEIGEVHKIDVPTVKNCTTVEYSLEATNCRKP